MLQHTLVKRIPVCLCPNEKIKYPSFNSELIIKFTNSITCLGSTCFWLVAQNAYGNVSGPVSDCGIACLRLARDLGSHRFFCKIKTSYNDFVVKKIWCEYLQPD